MAYTWNIGVFQAGNPGSAYQWNIGADQTSVPTTPSVELALAGGFTGGGNATLVSRRWNRILLEGMIGTDVQAYDAGLSDIAGLTPTDSNIIVGDGTNWVAESGDTARTSLGLGTGDSPTFTALTLSSTATPLYAGPWVGVPNPISPHTNIYGDLFCGNTGVGVARLRLASNANAGSVIWNGYYDNSYGRQLDSTKPSLTLDFVGISDIFRIRRSAAGVNPISWSDLLSISGSTGIVTVGGKIRSNTAFNLNGTDGVTQAASSGKVCDVTALAGGIATAQTQITYAADGTYNFDATSGKVSSITITNGRITAITTAA